MVQVGAARPMTTLPLCPVCGTWASRVVRDGCHYTSSAGSWDYALVQCNVCGLGFVDPLPAPDIVHSFYSAEYGSYTDGVAEGTITASKRFVGSWRMGRINKSGLAVTLKAAIAAFVEAIAGRVTPATLGVPLQLPKAAALMDLGYGNGEWLMSMHRLGWRNLHGFDIAENANNAARLVEAGISLSSGEFLSNDYPESHFDCIRLSHVLEHLTDPLTMLNKCRVMLKPGGFIALSQPCFRSWLTRLAFDDTLLVQLPLHLFHYTPRAMALMLEKAGFVHVTAKSYGTVIMLEDTVCRARARHGRGPLPHRVFTLAAPLYGAFCSLTGHGDFLSAYGVRP
jgi:2-polyprenyl-3-methyl-5-hydroxy-6-metoxy-1,4-benzoquinol methylase